MSATHGPLLSVADAAALAHREPATIRSWTHRGHLHPAGRDRTGRPLYTAQEVLDAERDARHRDLERAERARVKRDKSGRFGDSADSR